MTIKLTSPPAPNQKDYLANSPVVSTPPKEDACPICYENWKDGEESIIRTHCGHTFHRECLTTWFGNAEIASANTCPSCRAVCFANTAAKRVNELLRERSPNVNDVSFLYQTMLGAT